jgi:hypothetical protein
LNVINSKTGCSISRKINFAEWPPSLISFGHFLVANVTTAENNENFMRNLTPGNNWHFFIRWLEDAMTWFNMESFSLQEQCTFDVDGRGW